LHTSALQKNFFARAKPLTHHAFGNNAKQSASPEGLCPPQAFGRFAAQLKTLIKEQGLRP